MCGHASISDVRAGLHHCWEQSACCDIIDPGDDFNVRRVMQPELSASWLDDHLAFKGNCRNYLRVFFDPGSLPILFFTGVTPHHSQKRVCAESRKEASLKAFQFDIFNIPRLSPGQP